MPRFSSSWLACLALCALLFASMSGIHGLRALSEIETERSAGLLLAVGAGLDDLCVVDGDGHGDCPLCRLEADEAAEEARMSFTRLERCVLILPLPAHLSLAKRARDATIRARAPPLV